jgi:ketosteroid isomerase-like protein
MAGATIKNPGFKRPFASKPVRWLAAAVVVGILGVVFYRMAVGPPMTDDQRIRQVFLEGEKAAEAHDIPALMSFVSNDYKDDMGLNKERMRFLLAQAFRDQADTWVTVNDLVIQPQGDTATATADITVESRARQSNDSSKSSSPLTFYFKKEPGYRFLVIPTPKWRIVKATGENLPSFGDLGSFF